MILVDANLLIYAVMSDLPQSKAAQAWLDTALGGPTQVGLPWNSLIAFVRLVSNPRVFRGAVPVEQAWEQVEDWLDAEVAWIPQPTERHRSTVSKLVREVRPRSDDVQDLVLASLAIEHGLVLCSTDGDFAKYPGLSWRNPLQPSQ